MPTITPCLWFDTEGDEAAEFYTSMFPNSRDRRTSRHYTDAGPREAGTVLTVDFSLDGRRSPRSTAVPSSRSTRRSRCS